MNQQLEQEDKKHLFTAIVALKQLCVHPMLLLQGVFKEEQRRKSGELEIQAAEQQPADEGSIYPEQTFAELENY